jgi:rRNA maturation RNase YbeY
VVRPDVTVSGADLARPLGAAGTQTVVGTVLAGEGARDAYASVTFLSSQRMRALNRRSFGRDRATDIIAFGLPHGTAVVADLYVCPAQASRGAQEHGVPQREELVRVLVHGVLHVLGWDHPEGPQRQASPMWRRQEQWVRRLQGRGR